MAFQLHLGTETVGQMELPPALIVPPAMSLGDVLEQLRAARRGSVSVCEQEQLVGIFTERDAIRQMAKGCDLETPIEQIMSRPVVTISRDDTLETAIARMSQGGHRRLPVIDRGERPIGVLKVASILHHLVQHFPGFVYNLPPTPNAATRQREGA